MNRAILAAAAIAACLTATGAQAESCAELYRARNQIYHEKGWCMRGIIANRMFPDNAQTCVYTDWDQVPFSAAERRYYRGIIAQERAMGCAVPP